MMVVLGAFFSSTLSQLIWDRLPLIQVLQFPWRFLTLAAAGTALLCGFPFLLLTRARPRLANGVMAALMLAILAVELPYASPEKFLPVTDADFSPAVMTQRHLYDTTANEWEPMWVTVEPQAPVSEPLTFLAGQGRIMSATTSPAAQNFVVQAGQGARLQANTFYYPGWTVFVDWRRAAGRPRRPAGPDAVQPAAGPARGQGRLPAHAVQAAGGLAFPARVCCSWPRPRSCGGCGLASGGRCRRGRLCGRPRALRRGAQVP